MGRFLIETHLRTGRPIGELAASARGASQLALQAPGPLPARGRRRARAPITAARIAARRGSRTATKTRSSPSARSSPTPASTPAPRPSTPTWLAASDDVPSISTIWRVLKARGFVTPQPHKRPRSSCHRFAAELPNECWQADVTHVTVADGIVVEVLNIIDDHSRALRRVPALHHHALTRRRRAPCTAPPPRWGYPASFLTDNGAIFTATARGNDIGAIEPELLSLGHPLQTLPALPPPDLREGRALPPDPQEVPRQPRPRRRPRSSSKPSSTTSSPTTTTCVPIERIGRRTPIRAFAARERAYPHRTPHRLRRLPHPPRQVDTGGNRHPALQRPPPPHRRRHAPTTLAGRHARRRPRHPHPQPRRHPLRRLTLDPTRDYQPIP